MEQVTLSSNHKTLLEDILNRIEMYMAQRQDINQEINNILARAKVEGFDKKTIREMLKVRKLSSEEILLQESLRDSYLHALGLL